MKNGVLYISYDGMLEPLGQSQVLAYLKHLSEERSIHLISFEKPDDWADSSILKKIKEEIVSNGIVWHPLTYHKRPSALATAWDIFCGVSIGIWLIVRYRLRIVHARSYVPSVMALVLKRLTGAKYLFDMRGFWADERVDGEIWPPNGKMFQLAKSFERYFLTSADHVVSLTQAGRIEIENFVYLQEKTPIITVIPTCADLFRFVPKALSRANTSFTLGYVGSTGTWYRFDLVAACFAQLLKYKSEARFLILNRGQHDYIRYELTKAGVPDSTFEIITAPYSEVPVHMARMDAGIFFYSPTFSRLACSPTRLGEFLGCGIPCLSNDGVGDLSAVLEGERVGVAVKTFEINDLSLGLIGLFELVSDKNTPSRCVETAKKYFSLEVGVSKYRKIYDQLTS